MNGVLFLAMELRVYCSGHGRGVEGAVPVRQGGEELGELIGGVGGVGEDIGVGEFEEVGVGAGAGVGEGGGDFVLVEHGEASGVELGTRAVEAFEHGALGGEDLVDVAVEEDDGVGWSIGEVGEQAVDDLGGFACSVQ